MQGLYNIDSTLDTGNRKNTYVEAGIHENLTLTEIVYKPTEKSEFLAFYFEDENGDKLSHTEWPKTMDKPMEQMTDDEKEKILYLVKQQRQRIKQIVEAIIGKGNLSLQANNFKEMGEAVVNLTKVHFNKAKVRAKVVYDYRDYTSLSNNPEYTFIEPMSIIKEESAIRILNSDKLTRGTNQRNQEKKVDHPLEDEANSSADSGDDLPF